MSEGGCVIDLHYLHCALVVAHLIIARMLILIAFSDDSVRHLLVAEVGSSLGAAALNSEIVDGHVGKGSEEFGV
jgi:hypothetical protein